MVVLGCGTSVGVPAIGCGCEVCQSTNPKNNRTRSSVIFGLPGGNLLVDTTPEMRVQLIRERIGLVHAVVYTHEHADHIFGLDDLRLFPFMIGGPVPLYCQTAVEQRIRTSFDYAFQQTAETHQGSRPKLVFETITDAPFEVLGVTVMPIPLCHGARTRVFGFRIGDVAYCTDVSEIPAESIGRLRNLDTLILGSLRYKPHPTHLCVDEAVAIVRELSPRQTYFTHMAHELEYETLKSELPDYIQPAYDGLQVALV